MPTASTAGLLSLNNIGSLTANFTAPSSCSTAPGFVRTGLASPLLGSILMYAVGNCEESVDFPKDCIPNGEEVSKLWESLEPRELVTVLNYYSPGLHCPEAWSTVGVYAPGLQANGSTPTATADRGIFSPTAFQDGRPGRSISFPYADFSANMFTSALAPTETAVVCCPSGFSADPYAGCFSNFPVTSLADKSGCLNSVTGADGRSQEFYTTTFEFWGGTATATQFSFAFPTATDFYSKVTYAFDESGLPRETDELAVPRPTGDNGSELQGVAVVAPLFLVHGGGNDDGTNEGGREGDGGNQGEDGNDRDSSGGRLSPVATWVPITGVLAAWWFSVVAGLGLRGAW